MQERGFLELLFDFSFSEFIVSRVIKVVYALGMGAALIQTLGFIAAFFKAGAFKGIVALVLSPFVFLLLLLLLRIACEMTIAIFRIAENTQILAERSKQQN